MRRLLFGAALSAALTASAGAAAHITLDEPPKRDATMKTPPCGGTGARSASPPVFAPGATITLRWHETVVHPGFFRIALSTDGATFPEDPPDPAPPAAGDVLAIVPKVSGVTEYSADVTLPDAPCESCTLQLIQYMRQHSPPPYYYQCADIVIRDGGATSNDAGVAGGDAPDGAGSGDDGGCAVAAPAEQRARGGSRAPAWLLVAACAAALRARRTRRNRG